MNKTPGPDKYEIKGEIEQNTKKHRGYIIKMNIFISYIFGVSREKMTSSGIMSNLNSSNPGPGKYAMKTTLSDIKFSMRPRYKNDSELSKSSIPGC